MLPDIVHDIVTLLDRSSRFDASCISKQEEHIEQELWQLRVEYEQLFHRVFTHRDISRIIELQSGTQNGFSQFVRSGHTTKAALIDNSFYAIRRTLHARENELELMRAKKHLRKGQLQQVVLHCRNVLARSPWNEIARKILGNVASEPLFEKLVEDLLTNCSFRYVCSFGLGVLSEPHDLQVSLDGKMLFVADRGDNAVHRFSVDGDYLGKCNLSLAGLAGIFSDQQNNMWVCEPDRQRLVLVNCNGEQQQEVYLPDLLPDYAETCSPCWGASADGKTALILSDQKRTKFVLAKVKANCWSVPEDNDAVWSVSALDELDAPCGISICGDMLCLGSRTHGRIYLRSWDAGDLQPLGSYNTSQLKGFARGRTAIFQNHGRTLAKLSLEGVPIFKIELTEYLERVLELNSGVTTTETEEGELLFAPDRYAKCIHAFCL